MAETKYLVDSYLDWVQTEGIPIVEGFGVDLLTVETAPWGRLDARGAYVHLMGRGDFVNLYVCEIPPGAATAPQKHLFEEVIYVLDGRGSTTIEAASGARHSFEWATGSLFAIPLNARYRFYNGSGSASARLASVTNLPLVLNFFHNEEFVFNNTFNFADRLGDDRYFKGEGEFLPLRPGRHMWETNFVPDLRSHKLYEWKDRGAGGSNVAFILADGTMHAHSSEMPVGTYKKAHRHAADFHVFAVKGTGYSLYWYEGDKEPQRFDWKHGCVFAPADMLFHQHFNSGPDPARYLAVACGSMRHPFTTQKKQTFEGVDVDLKKGGKQIEYTDEDPRVHQMFEEALARVGATCRMDDLLAKARTPRG